MKVIFLSLLVVPAATFLEGWFSTGKTSVSDESNRDMTPDLQGKVKTDASDSPNLDVSRQNAGASVAENGPNAVTESADPGNMAPQIWERPHSTPNRRRRLVKDCLSENDSNATSARALQCQARDLDLYLKTCRGCMGKIGGGFLWPE